MKVKKTYRLEEETADKLASLSELEGKTATEIIEDAIRAYGSCRTDSHTSKASASEPESLEILAAQLDVKDRQIAELSARLADTTTALLRAQESVQAAQMLHGAEVRRELEAASDDDEPKGRFKKFKKKKRKKKK
jgi:predicted transcriptional regulator